jgi:hypothetical protein
MSRPNYQEVVISKVRRGQIPKENMYGIIVDDD